MSSTIIVKVEDFHSQMKNQIDFNFDTYRYCSLVEYHVLGNVNSHIYIIEINYC